MTLEEQIKKALGENVTTEQIESMTALLNAKAEEVKKTTSGTLDEKLAAVEKEKADLLKETMQRKEKIKTLSEKLEGLEKSGLTDKQKLAQAEAERLAEFDTLKQELASHKAFRVRQTALAYAKLRVSELKSKLNAEGKSFDLEKVGAFLEKHLPSVNGNLNEDGQPTFDADAMAAINGAVDEAQEFFAVAQPSPAAHPSAGGEMPGMQNAGSEGAPMLWDKNQGKGNELLSEGMKKAYEEGLLDAAEMGGTGPISAAPPTLDDAIRQNAL